MREELIYVDDIVVVAAKTNDDGFLGEGLLIP